MIYCVEDERNIRELLIYTLETTGFKAKGFGNGAELMKAANLGVMNLLPFPALDGGRLVFLVIEAIRRKPVNRRIEGTIHFAGLMLLMVLMVGVMYNDIVRIF